MFGVPSADAVAIDGRDRALEAAGDVGERDVVAHGTGMGLPAPGPGVWSKSSSTATVHAT